MSYLLQIKEDGKHVRYVSYKTEKGARQAKDKLEEAFENVACRIFKDVTYGEQVSLFDPHNAEF